ncbi:MAG: PAS domain S-box protein, partial [Deltaproteobacteria bacterium]
ARRELAESEQRFRAIFNSTNDALFIHDIGTGAIVDVNQTMCDMYGVTRDEALASEVNDLSAGVPPYSQAEALAWLNRAMAGEPQLFEWQAKRKNGELFWVEVNMRRAYIGANERIIVSVRDITERRQAQQQAEEAARDLHRLNRLISICASTLDLEELLEKILDETTEMTGLEGGTICFVEEDQTLHLACHRNASHETVQDLSTHVVRVGECLCGHCALKGEPLILENRRQVLAYASREALRNETITYHAAFPLNSGQRCIGVLCLFTRRDVKPDERCMRLIESIAPQLGTAMDNARLHSQTLRQAALLEKRVAERTAELQQANERLQELDRLKSMFIASMSHELRTPLNSIIGFSSILLNEWSGSLNDEQKENLDAVLRAGRHLLELVNDIIDVSKIEAGLLEIMPTRFDLAELFEEVRQSFAGEAEKKGLKLTVARDRIRLMADRRRLLQVLVNLVSNAIKYTESGEVSVRADLDPKRDCLTISIHDTGIGMGADQVKELFQPFRRLESHLTDQVAGTGLGLYLTR